MYASRPGGTRYLHLNDRNVLWSDIEDLHAADQARAVLRKTNLTLAHVQLNPMSKVILINFYSIKRAVSSI